MRDYPRDDPLGYCDICDRPNVPIAIDESDGFYELQICRTCVHADATIDRLLELAPAPRPPFIDVDTGKLIYRT